MAVLDSRLLFGESESIIGSTGTANVGDVINLSAARDIGKGSPLYLCVQVQTAVDSSGNGASVAFQLVSDGTGTIATSGQTVHVSSGAIAEATLVAGYRFVIALPREGAVYEQYLALQTVISGEAVTAGAIDAFITMDPPGGWEALPDAAN